MFDKSSLKETAGNKKSPIGVLFLCLARNCANTIPGFFEYLDRLQAHGFDCAAIIGENGSFDQTRSLIEGDAGGRIALLDTSLMKMGGSRLSRMAIGRQALLEAAKARGFREDYVCIADLDNVMTVPPDPAAMQTAIESLRADVTIFAVGATSVPVYYDLLSLRLEGFEFLSNLNREITEAKQKPFSYFRFHRERIYRNQRLITKSVPLLCESSFNGFCCYKASDYRLGSYRAADEADACEHVNFNLSIGRVTGKKMLISSDLAVQTPADHGPVGFCRFWYDRAMKRPVRLRLTC